MRLLFEGAVPEGDGPMARREFYIYVWIRDAVHVESFQAVLADAVTLVYRAPGYLTAGRIGRVPFNRAIQASNQAGDKGLICDVMRDLSCAHFPKLVRLIERIAQGEMIACPRLAGEEADYLAHIAGKVNV
ncbi:MAG: hypothetical protein GF418_16695 [Chitinivibrionales bacterium]|nr:hypothetical protein [Chitinivibrionales bacterium]